ncbi:MAG: hypothetical protein FJY56_15030 [Betaproteobacteria bacterium]|nr:hypothetical protein [Betaproteobacteria bacterium]
MAVPQISTPHADSEKVFAEQVRLVYQAGPAGAIAVMVVAWLYGVVVWNVAPRRELLLWEVLITLVSTTRIVLAYIRQRYAIDSHVREWSWALLALATATGVLWAYGGTALFPLNNPNLQLIAAFMLVGIPAGAVASFGPYALSYVCYLAGTIVPFALVTYWRGGDYMGWLLFASAVFMAFLIRVALWIEKTLKDNILQRLALEHMADGLAQSRDAAQAADRAKTSFLANMNHEVRTPLNAMIGMNELLLMSPLSAEQRQQAQAVHDASYSLLGMFDSVLDMSRIEAGALDLHEERFDPHAVVQRLEHLYRPVARRKNLDFTVAMAPDAPHAVIGDPVRWRQVLGILLDNALKFTDSGSVSVVIEVRMDSAANLCALRAEVIDTGIGISREDQYRLFQRFSQIDASNTRRHGGMGAGLGIASDLAKLMGGAVGVTSEPGKGSRFWFNARMKTGDVM